jgi:glutamine cyclotransferase
VLALVVPSLVGCGGPAEQPAYDPAAAAKQIEAAVAGGLPSSKLTVLDTLPHSTAAWTEGLEVADGTLYESTGVAGRSELRELSLKTGRVLRSAPLPAELSGAGITVIGSLIWQLTSGNGVALQWNRDTFNAGGRVPWSNRALGLCHDRDSLIASDGSSLLRVVDRNGVDQLGVIPVRLAGQPLTGLGELECLPTGILAAAVLGTDWIVGIEETSGKVLAASDVSQIVPDEVKGSPDKVVSGIAFNPGTDSYLITGRGWPTIARVRMKFS